MDAVQAAGCGHPGMPMGMAEIAQALWMNHLSHNPKNPNWLNRDRFVLSNGHGRSEEHTSDLLSDVCSSDLLISIFWIGLILFN